MLLSDSYVCQLGFLSVYWHVYSVVNAVPTRSLVLVVFLILRIVCCVYLISNVLIYHIDIVKFYVFFLCIFVSPGFYVKRIEQPIDICAL